MLPTMIENKSQNAEDCCSPFHEPMQWSSQSQRINFLTPVEEELIRLLRSNLAWHALWYGVSSEDAIKKVARVVPKMALATVMYDVIKEGQNISKRVVDDCHNGDFSLIKSDQSVVAPWAIRALKNWIDNDALPTLDNVDQSKNGAE